MQNEEGKKKKKMRIIFFRKRYYHAKIHQESVGNAVRISFRECGFIRKYNLGDERGNAANTIPNGGESCNNRDPFVICLKL